jgi:hypothetical protein
MSWRQLGQFVFVSRSLAMGPKPNQAPDKMVYGYGRSMYRIQYRRISGRMVTEAVCVCVCGHNTIAQYKKMVTGASWIEYDTITQIMRWLLV